MERERRVRYKLKETVLNFAREKMLETQVYIKHRGKCRRGLLFTELKKWSIKISKTSFLYYKKGGKIDSTLINYRYLFQSLFKTHVYGAK